MDFKTHGIYAAHWIPTDEQGHLLESALEENLKFVASRGVHGLMTLDSVAGFPFLSVTQRTQVVQSAIRLAGELPVIVNISDLRPAVSLELAAVARESGAAAVALMPPGFQPMTESDLIEYFVRIAGSAGLPVMLYDAPERTGKYVKPEVIRQVSGQIDVAAVMQNGVETDTLHSLAGLGEETGFVVFAGNETRLMENMSAGAVGCISGLAGATPEYLVTAFDAIVGNQAEKALAVMEKLRAIHYIVQDLEFPLDIAAALQARGFDPGSPKQIIAPATAERLRQTVENLANVYRQWDLPPRG